MNTPATTTEATEHINYQVPQPSLILSGNMVINPSRVLWANINANVGTVDAPDYGVIIQFAGLDEPVAFHDEDGDGIANALVEGSIDITPQLRIEPEGLN